MNGIIWNLFPSISIVSMSDVTDNTLSNGFSEFISQEFLRYISWLPQKEYHCCPSCLDFLSSW